MQAEAQQETLVQLRAALAQYHERQAKRAGWSRRFVPTGLAPIDATLPHGGLPCGAVTEILSEAPGLGAMTLAMRLAAEVCHAGDQYEERGAFAGHQVEVAGPEVEVVEQENLRPVSLERKDAEANPSSFVIRYSPFLKPPPSPFVVLDIAGDFYPPAAAAFGFDPEEIIVIRTSNRRDAFWAMDQALRCPGMGAVLALLPDLDERQSRRLQLAAEVSGSVGLLLGTPRAKDKSFAAVRVLIESDEATERRSDEGKKQTDADRIFSDRRFQTRERDSYGERRDCSTFPIEHSNQSASITAMSSRVPLFPSVASSLRRFVASVSILAVREGMPSGPFLVDLYHATGTCDLHSLSLHRSAVRTA